METEGNVCSQSGRFLNWHSEGVWRSVADEPGGSQENRLRATAEWNIGNFRVHQVSNRRWLLRDQIVQSVAKVKAENSL